MRKTLQQLGIDDYFYYPKGPYNAITDVAGVKVGQTTLIKGENIRTGVTVIIPPVDFTKESLTAGGFVLNGNGEVTGLHYILEEGRLVSPIFLTNTLSVGDVFSAVVDYYKGKIALPVIGECWDGYLNDIEGRQVKKEHVVAAIESAKGEEVEEGSVGAGTGMRSFGFKAGIGTASRVLTLKDNKKYTVGVLVNNNLDNQEGHHRYLKIAGTEIGKLLKEEVESSTAQQSSTIIVIATDIPLDSRQLNRICKRAVLGMGRIGIVSYDESGDFIISFSTAHKMEAIMEAIRESLLNKVFEAIIEATEEAFINSLLQAEEMTGRDNHKAKALPVEKIWKI